MHFVERSDDIETNCEYTPPTKIIRLENNGTIEDVHVMESEQEEEVENVMYLYVTEEGTILTTDGQQVNNNEEEIQLQTFENDQEQVIFIEVDENNENYTTVETEESVEEEEVLEIPDLPVIDSVPSAPPEDSPSLSSSVISVPEEAPETPRELWRCSNNCGSQFVHSSDLVTHQDTCDFKEDTNTSQDLGDFDKLSDEIITYFEVICEKGSRNTVKRKHKWLWQFLKEMLNDPIDCSCVWIDRNLGCFKIVDKEKCTSMWENYKHVKKMSTVGYGKQEFVACFEWYQKIKILRQIEIKGKESDVSLKYQFHPTFYHDFFEPYKFLTSIPREMLRYGKHLTVSVKKPVIRKLKSPKSPMYCSKNCGSQYINSSALQNHEKVCMGVAPSTSTEDKEEEEVAEKTSEETLENDNNEKDTQIAIVYPTNNKNVVMCSLCRKFWNTTGLRIHMKKAHGLSKIKVQTMDVYSPNKPVTVRFNKVGEVSL